MEIFHIHIVPMKHTQTTFSMSASLLLAAINFATRNTDMPPPSATLCCRRKRIIRAEGVISKSKFLKTPFFVRYVSSYSFNNSSESRFRSSVL
jgi:hypothetical protein